MCIAIGGPYDVTVSATAFFDGRQARTLLMVIKRHVSRFTHAYKTLPFSCTIGPSQMEVCLECVCAFACAF